MARNGAGRKLNLQHHQWWAVPRHFQGQDHLLLGSLSLVTNEWGPVYGEPQEIRKALASAPLFTYLCFTFRSLVFISHGNWFHFLRSTEHSDRARFHRMSECHNLLCTREPGSVNTARGVIPRGPPAPQRAGLGSNLAQLWAVQASQNHLWHWSKCIILQERYRRTYLVPPTHYATWPYFPWRHLRCMSVTHFQFK